MKLHEQPRWLCKAEWQGTALKFHIHGKNEDAVLIRARRYVKKMEGADTALEVKVLGKLRD